MVLADLYGSLQIVNFPFPTPPSIDALRGAEQCLLSISALQMKSSTTAARAATGSDLELTPTGLAMAVFPTSPRHSRMILAAAELASSQSTNSAETVHYALGLAAALTSESPFLEADTVVMAEQPPTGHNVTNKVSCCQHDGYPCWVRFAGHYLAYVAGYEHQH